MADPPPRTPRPNHRSGVPHAYRRALTQATLLPMDEFGEDVVGTATFFMADIYIGPHYPPAAISAEIGKIAIAAARLDSGYALLLHALHAGDRAAWKYDELTKRGTSDLHKQTKKRVNQFFEGPLREHALEIIDAAYSALNHRHAVMHTIWSLTGMDAMTPAEEVLAAFESPNPQAALNALGGREIDSEHWTANHPRREAPGPSTLLELTTIRRQLEEAYPPLDGLRFALSSALYIGKPAGATKVIYVDGVEGGGEG